MSLKKTGVLAALAGVPFLVCALDVDVPAGTTNLYTSTIGSGESTLVKTGDGRLHLKLGTTQSGFTGAISVNGGTLGLDSPKNLGTPSSITVANGATLDLSAVSGNKDAVGGNGATPTIAGYGFNNQGAIRRAGGDTQDGLLKGFTLADDAMFYNSTRGGFNGGTFNFNGHTIEKQGGGEFLFNGGTWKNPGNVVIKNGQLTLQNDATYAGGPSNLMISKGGTLCLWYSPGAGKALKWTLVASNNFSLATGDTHQGRNAWDGPVEVPSGMTMAVNPWGNGSIITLNGDVRNLGTIKKQSGNGTLRLTGKCTTNDFFSIEGGKVNIEGDGTGQHEIGQATTANGYGEINLLNAGYVHQYRGSFWVAGNGNNINTVTISNTFVNGYTGSDRRQINLGNDGSNGGYNGRLIVEAGSVVSNGLSIGYQGRGAVYQRGGDVYWPNSSSSGGDSFGGRGYGYYGLDAGTLKMTSWTGMGIWSGNGRSFFVQRGGTFTSSGGVTIGGLGRGEMYIGGGTATTGAILVGSDGDYSGPSDEGVLTVDNGASLSIGRGRLTFAHTNGFNAVVNLNRGGRFSAARMNTGGKGAAYGSHVYYNFDGGVLCPQQAWGFTDEWNVSANDPTRATIYDGGLTVDPTGAKTYDNDYSRIPFPLLRPYGRGIKSITLPASDSAFWSKNFLGPTRIRITGAGQAAPALVDFDHGTRKPRGVIVTGAGFGYDENTTATVDSWNGAETYPCTVETFEHSCTGGLTVAGLGGLTVAAANTWGGPTTVERGVLTFETAVSYPDGSPLVLRPAGTIDFKNINRTVPSITGAGRINNANLTVTNGLAFYFADASTNACITMTGRLTLGAGATVRVLDPEKLDHEVKPRVCVLQANGGIDGAKPTLVDAEAPWNVSVSGNKVYVYYPLGTAFIFR